MTLNLPSNAIRFQNPTKSFNRATLPQTKCSNFSFVVRQNGLFFSFFFCCCHSEATFLSVISQLFFTLFFFYEEGILIFVPHFTGFFFFFLLLSLSIFLNVFSIRRLVSLTHIIIRFYSARFLKIIPFRNLFRFV